MFSMITDERLKDLVSSTMKRRNDAVEAALQDLVSEGIAIERITLNDFRATNTLQICVDHIPTHEFRLSVHDLKEKS